MKITLRNKISFIVIFIWTILAGATYLGSQFIILKSFLRLEETQANENMLRVKHAIDNMDEEVLDMVNSWAIWDDSYKFIQDKNVAYIKSNLTIESFASTKMDMILYFDSNGRLVYDLVLNADHTKKILLPPALLNELTPIVNFKKINDSAQGFIALPTGLLIVGSHPIVTSKNTGPVRGVMIMAKYFTNETLAKLIDSTKVNTTVYHLDVANKSAQLKPIVDEIKKNAKFYLIRDNSYISQYSLLNDIYNHPIALLKTMMPRNVFLAGVETTRYYGIVFVFYSIILVIFLWFLLQQLIVRRIEKLNLQMQSFEKPVSLLDIFSQRLPDELTTVAALYQQATHDPLTKLANRNLLYQIFKHFSVTNPNCTIALLFFDMDKFKSINDILGHEIGDQLLIYMSKQLTSCLREHDLAARLGGDEFIVMLVNVDKNNIIDIANRIFKRLEKPLLYEDHKLYPTSSMGISLYPKDGRNIVDLLKKADIALYRAKENGGNHYLFYSDELKKAVQNAKKDEIELQAALEKNELLIYFQPIYHASTKRINTLEVLLRWQHPKKGLISANDFIRLAEQTGLIIPIERWVLDTACKQVKIWESKGLPVIPISVNLSILQTSYISIYQLISSIIDENNFDYHYLELELKETVFFETRPAILNELHQLKARGIQLTVDNFSMGYSSLLSLRQAPINKLKIDKSLILNLEDDPVSKAMTLAIISIAHQLNLQVIAAGVETSAVYEFLLMNQVDFVQGYFFSPPLDITHCENLLRSISQKTFKSDELEQLS